MKTLLFTAITLLFISCHQDDVVQWHEPGAKYKGVIHYGLPTQVSCCKPGDNCAKKGIKNYIKPGSKFVQYINENNIKGYFENENWQSLFPELVDHPEVVTQIIRINPVVKLMDNYTGDKSIVIFQTSDPAKTSTEDILFVVNNMNKAIDEPCPEE